MFSIESTSDFSGIGSLRIDPETSLEAAQHFCVFSLFITASKQDRFKNRSKIKFYLAQMFGFKFFYNALH
jgi:hypothetical protein